MAPVSLAQAWEPVLMQHYESTLRCEECPWFCSNYYHKEPVSPTRECKNYPCFVEALWPVPVKTAHLLPPQESQRLLCRLLNYWGIWTWRSTEEVVLESDGNLQAGYPEWAPSQKLTRVRPGYYSNGRLRAACPMMCLPGRNVETIRHFMNTPKEEGGL